MIDAQRDARHAVLTRSLVHCFHQALTDTSPAKVFGDGNRELRCLLVDEPLAMLGIREEPVPDGADRPSRVLCNETGVTGPAPLLVEDRNLRMSEDPLARRELTVCSPVERRIQHLPEEREIRILELANPNRCLAHSSDRSKSRARGTWAGSISWAASDSW